MEVGSGIGIPTQMQGIANAGQTFLQQKPIKKKGKLDKKKMQHSGHGGKKFPELKMMVNGDYRSSNYTMSSDDEVFNVSYSQLIIYLIFICLQEVPTDQEITAAPVEHEGHELGL